MKQKLKKGKQTSIKHLLSYVCFGTQGAEVIRTTVDRRNSDTSPFLFSMNRHRIARTFRAKG